MKQWFGSLQQQEKVLVASGSVVLAIMLFYVALSSKTNSKNKHTLILMQLLANEFAI